MVQISSFTKLAILNEIQLFLLSSAVNMMPEVSWGWQLSLPAQHQQRALCLTGSHPAWLFLATFLLPAPKSCFLVLAIIPNFQAFAWCSSARIATMLESLMETQYQIKPELHALFVASIKPHNPMYCVSPPVMLCNLLSLILASGLM